MHYYSLLFVTRRCLGLPVSLVTYNFGSHLEGGLFSHAGV